MPYSQSFDNALNLFEDSFPCAVGLEQGQTNLFPIKAQQSPYFQHPDAHYSTSYRPNSESNTEPQYYSKLQTPTSLVGFGSSPEFPFPDTSPFLGELPMMSPKKRATKRRARFCLRSSDSADVRIRSPLSHRATRSPWNIVPIRQMVQGAAKAHPLNRKHRTLNCQCKRRLLDLLSYAVQIFLELRMRLDPEEAPILDTTWWRSNTAIDSTRISQSCLRRYRTR